MSVTQNAHGGAAVARKAWIAAHDEHSEAMARRSTPPTGLSASEFFFFGGEEKSWEQGAKVAEPGIRHSALAPHRVRTA